MAARVSKDNFEAEVLQASIPVLVEFYSDSCIPCKQMSPILGDIEDDYEDRLKVVKVNANFDGGTGRTVFRYGFSDHPVFQRWKGSRACARSD